ncbi:DUF4231 domain-containing protein [Actinoplanes sp. Pm04-4]|uniref:DUF4231 domain-containing protein n=1 Tax=Paractinoplanes pyxinae TaxID=2997416 RepID=A0ABT4B577_9ACTN|nr:DUF4231 domain-containing protein [Actinoplanes pyxinae]MCY1141207.1 DUF4231 domain-containing protein [Actinoplanes pyxinae]
MLGRRATILSFDLDYPALYYPADSGSLAGQRRFVRATRVRLFALFAAALGGAWSWRAGSFDLFGLLGFVAFAIALGAATYLQATDPARSWYEARTASESIKTLTWRYIVGGDPFPLSLPETAAEKLLRARLAAVIDPDKLPAPSPSAPTKQITDRMRSVRASSFEDRRAAYRDGRIEDQRGWYARKAVANERLKQTFTWVAIALELAGFVGAAFKAFGQVDVDLLGVFSAAAAGLAAWTQARSYADNQRAYSRNAYELGLIADELDGVSKADWPRFVDEAENAISTEHTQWRAAKGLGAPRQRNAASAPES